MSITPDHLSTDTGIPTVDDGKRNGVSAKDTLIILYNQEAPLKISDITGCFRGLITENLILDEDVQNFLRGFFWTLLAPIPNRNPKNDDENLPEEFDIEKYTHLPEDIDHFLGFAAQLFPKHKARLRISVRYYVQDLILSSHDLASLERALDFSIKICEKFGFNSNNIFTNDSEVPNTISSKLIEKFGSDNLEKLEIKLKKLNLCTKISPTNSRPKHNKRPRRTQEEELADTLRRITHKVHHPNTR